MSKDAPKQVAKENGTRQTQEQGKVQTPAEQLLYSARLNRMLRSTPKEALIEHLRDHDIMMHPRAYLIIGEAMARILENG